MTPPRIGQGFDVHRFCAGRALRLCGVELEGEVGLEGHSDADVALHAVTDAVLGALAAGDLGALFPSSDPRFEHADSRRFLAHAMALARERRLEVASCDLTIVGERPRIGPLRERLRAALACELGAPLEVVSVKATTTEGLGFVGRGEGLAALAVVLLVPSDD